MATFGAYMKEITESGTRYRDLLTGQYFSSEEGNRLDSAARAYEQLGEGGSDFRDAMAEGLAEAQGMNLQDAQAEADAYIRYYAEANAAGDEAASFYDWQTTQGGA